MFLILQGSKVDNKTGSPCSVLSPKAALVRQENQEGACAASRAQGTEVRKARRSACTVSHSTGKTGGDC